MLSISTDKTESPKFQQIVETATELFEKYGVKRVTVEEICATAQVSKMTFYNYFKNKITLAEYIIFAILEDGQNKFDIIIDQDSPFSEKMNQFIKFKMDYAKRFSKEFLIDFMTLSPKIHKYMVDFSEKNQLLFIHMIEKAQNNGEVRDDLSLKFVTLMFNTFIELREDDKLLTLYNNTEELTSDMINFFFYGIMGKK